MANRTVAIIQARMGSTRLPGKVLKEIAGRPMLWHVVERTRIASLLDDFVVATSTKKRDDAIEDFCRNQSYPCFRGDEADVLDRYYQAASQYDADCIVRITSDCPLIPPEIIDRAIRIREETGSDYASNKVEYNQPDGLDVEVFSFDALQQAWEQADSPEEREHVTLSMLTSDEYRRRDVSHPLYWSEYDFVDDDTVLRWTVDYPEDLEFIREIYNHLFVNGEWLINHVAVLELLVRRPELLAINEDAPRQAYVYE